MAALNLLYWDTRQPQHPHWPHLLGKTQNPEMSRMGTRGMARNEGASWGLWEVAKEEVPRDLGVLALGASSLLLWKVGESEESFRKAHKDPGSLNPTLRTKRNGKKCRQRAAVWTVGLAQAVRRPQTGPDLSLTHLHTDSALDRAGCPGDTPAPGLWPGLTSRSTGLWGYVSKRKDFGVSWGPSSGCKPQASSWIKQDGLAFPDSARGSLFHGS